MSDLTSLAAVALAEKVRGGEVTAREVVRQHLERIAMLDPSLGAFVRLDPTAEAEADRLDRAGPDGPLAGVPVAVKDNLCTAGLETCCGSRVLEGFVPCRDATVVARLRAAGAIVIGKTNLDEFGMGSSTETSSAGPSRNPWDPNRVAGGSSGGSAVAVAARMVPLALGTDTGGSVRQPAAFCGAVGLKPTYGRVSRSGVVAYGSSLDQVGPIARTVADAATALAALAGADPEDATTRAVPLGDPVAACLEDVAGMRVALPRQAFDPPPEHAIATRIREAADCLARAGAEIQEVNLPHTRYAVAAYYLIATAEASSNLARYDGVRFGPRHDEGDGFESMYRRTRSIGFGAEVKRRIMLGTFALSAGYQARYYGRALAVRERVRRELDDVWSGGTDVLLMPTTPTTAFRLGERLDDPVAMYLSDTYTVTSNLAGIPSLTVPLGHCDAGLPIGGQLIGPAFGERSLLRAGAALERAYPPVSAPEARSS